MEPADFERLLKLLKALAHESRLKIIGLIAEQEYSVGELADLLELKEPTVSHHLAKLQELNLVTMRTLGTTHYYQLNSAALQQINRELLTPAQVASIADNVESNTWERKVLNTYFDGTRLTKIPDVRKKRDVILNWLVTHFEYDIRYSEKQVNEIIRQFHPDTATLRRELIGNKLMQRENGVYWRVLIQAEHPQITP